MKNFKVDTHMHTLASGHAFNTLDEMIAEACRKKMDVICITEHGPEMPGTAHPYYHTNLRVVNDREPIYGPKNADGICHRMRFIKGLEANIIDYEGNTDYDTLGDNIADLKYIIASFHTVCLEPGAEKQNTAAYIGAMQKPYVMTLGHIDDGRIPCDFEAVIKAAKENNVLIELNNSSMAPTTFRQNAVENALEYLKICKDLGAKIILSSDAHYKADIGNFSLLYPLLAKVDFPEDLIMNTYERFIPWFDAKYKERLKKEGLNNAV